MQIEIIILVIFVLLSGFFSGIEVAFFSISNLDLKQIVKQKKKHAKILSKLKANPNRFIITVLIGNNLVNIFAASLATKVALDTFGDSGLAIATGIMTLVILIAGEIIPKAYCSRNAEKVSLLAAPYLNIMAVVLTPIIWVLEIFTKFVLKILGIKEESEDQIDAKTVRNIIQIGRESGNIQKSESELITNVFEFHDTTVEEAMITKEQVATADVSSKMSEVLKLMVETGYSRIPLHDGDPNKIVGIVHFKQLIDPVINRRKTKLQAIMTEPYYVPETKKINRMFKGFQQKQVHMAIVVNEYGGFGGIITLEDVLEELVGEVYDETDIEESAITKLSNHFIIKGNCSLEEVNKMMRTRLDDDESDTINGYVLNSIGRIPRKGEVFKISRLTFTVLKADKTHVREFKVEKQTRKR